MREAIIADCKKWGCGIMMSAENKQHVCLVNLLETAAEKGLYEKIFDAANEPIMVFDQQMQLVLANESARKLYDLGSSCQGARCWDIFQAGAKPCSHYPGHCWLRKVVQTGQPLRTTITQSPGKGENLPVEISASLIDCDKGADANVVVVLRWMPTAPLNDIDFFSKNIDQIEDLPRFTEALLESMGEGLLVIDTDYRIRNINRRFAEISGHTPQEVIGEHCYTVTHGSHIPCWSIADALHQCPAKKAFDSGEVTSVVHTHYDAQKHPHFVEVKAFPLKDSSGNVSQVIETHTDVTEKKNLELHLRQAEKMESLGTLAGGIAHDLNNILTPILGYSGIGLELLKESDPSFNKFHQIHEAAKRASDLVRQILAFSRRQVLEKTVVDMNRVIGGIQKMLDRVIREDISIVTDLEEGLWTFHADRTQMEQILFNLVVNARDAMPDGGKVYIETKNVADLESICHTCGEIMKGPYVLLQISDEGLGIEHEILSRIFDPFFTTKEMGHGTGIGLSTIMGIMHQHGGHVNVYSEVGMGSVFKVYLPVCKDNNCEGKENELIVENLKQLYGRGETLLLVDDNRAVRETLKNMLEGYNYKVIIAADGQEALGIFSEQRGGVDLIVTDVVMPGMNGRQLMLEIHRQHPTVPFLFMSGYSINAIHNHFILEDGIEYIQKPPMVKTFLQKIKKLLEK